MHLYPTVAKLSCVAPDSSVGGGAGMRERGIGWVGEMGSWPSSKVPLFSTRVLAILFILPRRLTQWRPEQLCFTKMRFSAFKHKAAVITAATTSTWLRKVVFTGIKPLGIRSVFLIPLLLDLGNMHLLYA